MSRSRTATTRTKSERAIGDFGQSLGTVAFGFILIDMSDPQRSSGARDSYGYKQLLSEPFLGGGLLTALSIPLLVRFGLIPSLIASTPLELLMIGLGIRRINIGCTDIGLYYPTDPSQVPALERIATNIVPLLRAEST